MATILSHWNGLGRACAPIATAAAWQRDFELHNFAWNLLSLSYTHSFSQTVSLTGTVTYTSLNGHRLVAPLVRGYFAHTQPAEFKVKLLKTFGKR
jgi:hypothetical protein